MKPYLPCLALCILVACGPESGSDSAGTDTDATDASTSGTSTSGASSTAPTTGVSSTAPTTGASSTDPTTDDEPFENSCDCSGPCDLPLCDAFTVNCETDSCDPAWWWAVTDEAALECAIAGLRDGKPGFIEWSREFGFHAGTDEVVRVMVLPGGSVLRRSSTPKICKSGPTMRVAIAEPGHFEGCLAEPDGLARFFCMTDGLLDEFFECTPAGPGECEPDEPDPDWPEE
ncbi:hypothetical protein [Nannocystis punicea]|uniref:Uncharacterized protein n=1 Tax=Nannocystis punicea TaxID=2995304 RepID=A0ABY7H7F8_9BACT|nr:hypothetical protein [Nannocystis poenicansa]WAS95103.1 hypothetical protein O0S08_02990 [Nannocystis poenicansa]